MSKSTLIAIVVFALLLGGVFLARRAPPERGITRVSFTEVQTDSIDRLVIEGPKPVELRKKDDAWELADGKPANERSVTALLEALQKVTSSDLVTRDAEKYAELEVDDEKGTRVRAEAGGTAVAELTLGKAAAGGAHVRVGEEVYLVKGVYPYVFAKERSQWLKLEVFDVDANAVDRLEVALADETPYVLVKGEAGWAFEDPSVVPDGFRFDTNAASSLASAVARLRAKDIPAEPVGPASTGLEGEVDRITLAAGADTRATLLLGGPVADEEQSRYAAVEGGQPLLVLQQANVDRIRKRAVDLRDLGLVSLDPEKVKSLALVSGKDRLVLEKQGTEWKVGSSTEEIPADFTLDPIKVTQRLNALKGARGAELAEGRTEAELGLEKPSAFVTATLEDDSKVTLSFGNELELDGKKLVGARGNADDALYLVTPWVKNNLSGQLSTFAKSTTPQGAGGMPNIDPASLANLPPEVRESLMKQLQQQQQQQQMMEAIRGQAPPPSDG